MAQHTQTISQAVPTWCLLAALLASAITIGLDLSGVVTDMAQSVVVWLIAAVGFAALQAAWWIWRRASATTDGPA
jgi:hypothetical protein